jgi:tetratricopeptide (TPR) repeat protein
MKNDLPRNQPELSLDGLEDLRIAHAAHPENMDTAAKLAQIYADKGWLNEAIELYKTVIGRDGANYPLLLEYGNICFRKQELDESLRIFRKLTVLKPGRVEGWNNLGIVQHALAEDGAALESFEKVLELEPDNAGALLNLGNCRSAQGKHGAAIELFVKAVEIRPDFADAWFNLGNAYCATDEYGKAIEAFEKAVRYQREFPSALKNMGFAHEQLGNVDKALDNYLQALKLSKGDAGLYVNIANAYLSRGDYEEAKTYYLQSVKLSPKEIAGWMGLRHLALLKGDIDSYAKSTMAVLSRIGPDAVAESLMILRELNHFSEVDELLCKADAASAEGDELDAERLLAYQRTDSYPGKIIALVQQLKDIPSPSDHILSCLARHAFDINDHASALGYLEKIRGQGFQTVKLLWRVCIALKEWEKAQRLIRQYLDAHHDCPDAWYFLAKIKASNREPDAAREFLVKALEMGFSEVELLDGDPDMKKAFEGLKARKENS